MRQSVSDWTLNDRTGGKPAADLDQSEVHLWRIATDLPPAHPARSPETLDPGEKSRAEAFWREVDRIRFIVSHNALRRILGRYLDIPPEKIVFSADHNGKPVLATSDRPEFHFSLAHSGDWAIVGVAHQPLGVDVEKIRPLRDLDGLVSRCCSQIEREHLASLPSAQRLAEFFRIWTAKEAVLKALGVGLRTPMARLTIPVAANENRVTVASPEPDSGSAWEVFWSDVDEVHSAALAVPFRPDRVSFGEWQ